MRKLSFRPINDGSMLQFWVDNTYASGGADHHSRWTAEIMARAQARDFALSVLSTVSRLQDAEMVARMVPAVQDMNRLIDTMNKLPNEPYILHNPAPSSDHWISRLLKKLWIF